MPARHAVTLLLLLGLGLAPLPARGGSLRADVLYLLPAESGEVAFVDLQEVRASPHYALLKQRLIPPRFAQFERFVSSLGVDVDHDLDWLAWSLMPASQEFPTELFLGIVQGQFDPERVQKFFAGQKISTFDYNGVTLYPFGGGKDGAGLYFAFLDSSTAVFGFQRGVEYFLDTRIGARDNLLRNEALLSRISEVNGRSPVWVVLDEHYTRLAVRQILPEVARFPEFGSVGEKFLASMMQIEVARDVTLDFQAWCRNPSDAQTFSLLLQAGLAAQSWKAKETNPALGQVLSQAEVRSSGDRLQLHVTAGEETLQSLLKLR